MSKAQITLVLPNFRLGGAERQAVELATQLHGGGWGVSLLVCEDEGPLRAAVERAGIPWEDLQTEFWHPKWSPRFWLNLLRTIWRIRTHCVNQRVAILQSFLYWENQVALAASVLTPRLRATIAGRRDTGRFKEGRPHYQWIENLTNRFATAIVCNSEGVREDVLRRELVDPARVLVIPNGVDTERFTPGRSQRAREAFPQLAQCRWLVGTVGNLKRQKRHDLLIEAIATMDPALGIGAIIVGHDRGEGPALERLIADRGLADRVVLAGPQEDIPAWLHSFDAFVLSSDHEGMPNVVLEAMASGLPVITRPVEGIAELITDGEHGLIVEGKVESIAAAIKRLQSSPELGATLGSNARRRVQGEFNLASLGQRYGALYERLLAAKSGKKERVPP
jgi:glycosyltransferase involved in cell wall biosynthesis